MSGLLPTVPDLAAYRRIFAEDDAWHPAIEEIRRRHALPEPLERTPLGSHIVWYAARAHVIKLFTPLFPGDYETEAEVLPLAHGRLGVRTPQVQASGVLDGWPYLVLDRVPGVPAAEVWPEVSRADRLRLVEGAGRVLAAFQALPLDDEARHARDWHSFVDRRLAKCERRGDLPVALRGEIPSFLADLALRPTPGSRTVRLYADLTEDHLLLTRRGARWEIASVIDFADALVGDPLYDAVAPGLGLAGGDRELQSALLRGMGLDPARRSRLLMGWTLLHAYLDFREIGSPAVAASPNLEALANALWPPA